MRKLYIIPLFLITTWVSFSQKSKKDTLKTEEITVVKPYTPSISAAFKVKSDPTIDESKRFQKENVTYSIFSIPVASTFTPSKGKVQGLRRAPKERFYENYISAGFGNYLSPLIKGFIHAGDQRYNDFGVFLDYYSSQGGIKDVLLDDNYSSTNIDMFYKQFDRDFNWKVNLGYGRDRYNYYGLPSDVTFNQNFLDAIDEKQVYNNMYLGGSINFDESVFEGATIEFVNFFDYYKSNEFRFIVKPKLNFPISTEFINAEILIDYVNGKFNQNYLNTAEITYSFLNLGINPNFEILRDDLSVNLGVKLYYTFDLENGLNKFKAYPNVTGSFNLVNDLFILQAGVTGDLIQNTYKEFSNENPFVSPTLNMQQTDQQYKAFIGAKGKFASNIGYNLNVSYQNEKDKTLFIQNPTRTDGTLETNHAFEAGNSFKVIYDEISTINVFGELNFEISKEFFLVANVSYSHFNTANELEAWNLPNLTGRISAEYKANDWFIGTKMFFGGNTKDYVVSYGQLLENGSIIENKMYADLNFNGGYIFSDRLSVFAKINNAISKSYNRFVNYPVQSIQVLAGVTYKFDL